MARFFRNGSPLKRLKASLAKADQWLRRTPDRSLEEAYEAALQIRALEEKYFQGGLVPLSSDQLTANQLHALRSDLQQYLTTVKVRLAEFQLSYRIVNFVRPQSALSISGASDQDQSTVVFEKIKFIDAVLSRYREVPPPKALVTIDAPSQSSRGSEDLDGVEALSDQTGVLPRSILGTISQIQKNLDPKTESKVVQNFRTAKTKTVISVRFMVFLILITIGAQFFSKAVFIGPVVDHLRQDSHLEIFLNQDMRQEGLEQLQLFREDLEFRSLIGQINLDAGEMETSLREKAAEIAEEFRAESANAIKNVFADLFSLGAFTIFLMVSKRELQVLRSFLDELAYGLSDSAKAFIIIMVTDIFVGYHSPHGWEVLLTGLARHLGLPENQDFISLFIATFPVILDTIFKYWIFRYLNRISPSAVATLKNMNE